MIRITDDLTIRRVAGQLAVCVMDGYHAVSTTLNAKQARDAAEAFNVLAVMLEAAGDDSDKGQEEEKEAA